MYWEKLVDYVAVEEVIHSHPIVFLVERPHPGFRHHCTIRDVVKLLSMLPGPDVRNIDLVVFRQSTHKQRTIAGGVWGRLGYWSTIGRYSGPGIYLEAQQENLAYSKSRSLWPEEKAEMRRLIKCGFQVEDRRRDYRVSGPGQAVRASQLYRTVPHEIGHYMDYLDFVKRFGGDGDNDRFLELYDAKPGREKEVYAHAYADRFWAQMEADGRIPFDPCEDDKPIRAAGVDPSWFWTAAQQSG